MKLAWLVWYDYGAFERGDPPELFTSKPDGYAKIIQIVYAEITE